MSAPASNQHSEIGMIVLAGRHYTVERDFGRMPETIAPARVSQVAVDGSGRVHVLRGDWNETWFAALEAFPEGRHDDDADATSRAFNAFLSARLESEGFLELLRRQTREPEAR